MLPHKKFKKNIPVRDGDTSQIVGQAIPAYIIGAHVMRNSRPYMAFKGENVVCAFDAKKPDEIVIYPRESIDFY